MVAKSSHLFILKPYWYHMTDIVIIDYVLASSEYGIEFAAAVVNKEGNVMGTQFHPEKSGDLGLKMLENFVGMC